MKLAVSTQFIETASLEYDKIRGVYVVSITMVSGKTQVFEYADKRDAENDFDKISLSMQKPFWYDNKGK